MAEVKKAYIEYPIPIECDLQCKKCFHAPKWALDKIGPEEAYKDKYRKEPPFTNKDFVKWRDKHLSNHSEFLVELQGGECSHPKCQKVIFDIIETLGAHGKTKFQLQSNGTGDKEFYQKLIKYKDLIDRIGFTYHRDEMHNVERRGQEECDRLNKRFNENAQIIIDSGIKFYVKEILLLKHKDDILNDKRYWEERGVEFRLQDFKTLAGRLGFNYTFEEFLLVHPEYRHQNKTCNCRELYGKYTNIIIRGYDYFAGDVIACWHSPVAVGSIVDDWYKSGYTIKRSINDTLSVVFECEAVDNSDHTLLEDDHYPNGGNEMEHSVIKCDSSITNNAAVNLRDEIKRQHERVVCEIKSIEKKISQLNNERTPLIERCLQLEGGIDALNMVIRSCNEDPIQEADQDLLHVKRSLRDQI